MNRVMSFRKAGSLWCAGVLTFVLAQAPFGAGGALAASVEGRIVAIADIHGAYDEFVAVLKAADLIDANNVWTGGAATVVQTGDFLDRGADSRKVMDLLQSLQEQAKDAGGEVVVLLGNHEAMNLLGFLGDVGSGAFATFATEESAERQAVESRNFGKWLKQRARRKKERVPTYGRVQADAFAREFPLGYFEYRDAMRADGEYGGWLRTLPMIVERQGIVFVHGGISPKYTGRSIEQLNEEMRAEIRLLDGCRDQLLADGVVFETSNPNEMVIEGLAEIEALKRRLDKAKTPERAAIAASLQQLQGCVGYDDWFLVKGESPIWYRGFAKLEGEEALETVAAALEGLGALRFVVGHTPQDSRRVESRVDGRVFLLDTGMLTSVYEGRPSALEFVGERVTAIYLDGREVLERGAEEASSGAGQSARLGVPGLVIGFLARSHLLSAVALAGANSQVEYVDASGRPLPFASDDELIAFLNEGEIEFGKQTDIGVNRPHRVKVSLAGVSVDAVFRTVDKLERQVRTGSGRRLAYLRDTYRYEPAAYEIGRMLGFDRVPAAVLRTERGKRGSLQVWLHGMIDEEKRLDLGVQPKDLTAWQRQTAEQKLFDRLIGNVDRNQGNLLIDPDSEKVWLIDHTRSFAEMDTPEKLQLVTRCKRSVYEAMMAATEEDVRSRMAPFLLKGEVNSLWSRWQKLVKRLGRLIREYGEDVVLY